MSFWIYVIECEHGCVYVGRTRLEPDERFAIHLSGTGSEWTRLHPPIRWLVPPRQVEGIHAGLEEDMETKIWMREKGIEVVRGGSYARPELTQQETALLRRELWHDADACTRCGREGHFIRNCYATTTVNGTLLTGEGAGFGGITARYCAGCGSDISDRPENHTLCHRCFLDSDY
jgi:predicted GIY-YIG superfamily endonuclease